MRMSSSTALATTVTRIDSHRLKKIATEHHCSISELARWALNDWLETRDYVPLGELGKAGRPRQEKDAEA